MLCDFCCTVVSVSPRRLQLLLIYLNNSINMEDFVSIFVENFRVVVAQREQDRGVANMLRALLEYLFGYDISQ